MKFECDLYQQDGSPRCRAKDGVCVFGERGFAECMCPIIEDLWNGIAKLSGDGVLKMQLDQARTIIAHDVATFTAHETVETWGE